MIATPSSPTHCAFPTDTMPSLSKSTGTATITSTSICDYHAGILDVSDHATVDVSYTYKEKSFIRSQNKKAMAVLDIIMMSDCHKSEPLLDFDLSLLEQIVAGADEPNHLSSDKRVRFAEYDVIHLVTCRADMSQEEMDDIYMSHEEQMTVKQSAFDELLLVSSCTIQNCTVDSCLDQDSICVRGLENHMVENAQRFRETVNRLYDIVYDCQTYEDENGVQLPEEYLSQNLIQISERCAVQARRRAILDEQEAKQSQ